MTDPDLAKLDPYLAFASRLSRSALIDFLKRDQPDERHLFAGVAPAMGTVDVTRPNTPESIAYAPVLDGLKVAPNGTVYANVIIQWNLQSPAPNLQTTLSVTPLGKKYALVHGPLDDVLALATEPAVQALRLDQPAFPTLDKSVPAVLGESARHGRGGDGVVVVIIDVDRLDFHHPDFRDEAGRTRVERLFELAREGTDGRWTFVHAYDAAQINADLRSGKPYSVVPLRPHATRGHGTHVAGIAVGNGCASEKKYTGMAPNATLLYFNIGEGPPGKEKTSAGAILAAIKEGFAVAGHRPCVVNLSLGAPLWDWHDNFADDDQIASVMDERAGRAVVAAAGNDGYKFKFQRRSVGANQTIAFDFVVPHETTESETIGIWHPATTNLAMSLTDSNDHKVDLPASGAGEFQLGSAAIKYDNQETNTTYRHCLFTMIPTGKRSSFSSGRWTLTLENLTDSAGDVWVRIGMNTNMEWVPKPTFFEAGYSVCWPGTVEEVITVGACYHDEPIPTVVAFSSRGPTYGGRKKPDLVAPGFGIQSTNSRPDPTKATTPMYEAMKGTSMAAPHVTGLVALMLQQAPALSANEIRRALLDAAEHPQGKQWDPAFGHGLARMPIAFAVVPSSP